MAFEELIKLIITLLPIIVIIIVFRWVLSLFGEMGFDSELIEMKYSLPTPEPQRTSCDKCGGPGTTNDTYCTWCGTMLRVI